MQLPPYEMNEVNQADKFIKLLEIEFGRINHFDRILFSIKVWTITLVAGLIGFAFKLLSDSKENLFNKLINELSLIEALIFIALIATIMFGSIDLIFRRIQLRHVRNSKIIRKYLKATALPLSNSKSDEVLDKIWNKELDPGKGLKGNYWYALLFYAFITVMLILLYYML